MKKLIHSIALFISILSISKGYSQSSANYTVTRNTGITYNSIEASSPSFFTWRNTTSNQDDDNRSYQEPIGFDFWYLGIRYTEFSANLNGTLDFSSSTSDGNNGGTGPYGPNYNNLFSTANQTMLALAPVYDDLWTGEGGTTPVASSIFYLVSGTSPNRVLTVEWKSFDKWNSSTGSLNFQVKLYETNGAIEFIYGNMTAGTSAFTYTCGINGNWTSGSPTSETLLTQQTENTTTFNYTPSNNLSSLPASYSELKFTPPEPVVTPTGLSFSNIGKTSMILHWTDNANNEIGYAIYNSIDDSDFVYVGETSANATSITINDLYPGSVYSWKVHGFTEGDLGTALTGTATTENAGTIQSIKSGDWSSRNTWDCHCVPTLGDNVTISDENTVTLNTNGECNMLTVGEGNSGKLEIGNNSTGRTLLIDSDLVIATSAIVTTGSHDATHTMMIDNNIINNGTLDLAPESSKICNVSFNNSEDTDQVVSGEGSITNFNEITVNLISSAKKVQVTSSHFSAAQGFLTIVNGDFELSTSADVIPFTSDVTIPEETNIWLNDPNATMSTTGGNVTLLGSIKVSAGTINIGNAADNNLIFNNGTLTMEGGTMNVAGRIDKLGVTALVNIDMSGGALTLATEGSTTAGKAPLTIDEVGSNLTMSGGKIIIRKPGSGNWGLINTGATNGSITGGIVQIGDENTSASSTFQVNSSQPLPSLVVGDNIPVTVLVTTNPLTIKNDLLISEGTFNANDLNTTIGGDFTNNSTFIAGAGTMELNGTSDQNVSCTDPFTNLSVNKTSGLVNLSSDISVQTLLTLTSGKIFPGDHDLTIGTTGTISGASASRYIMATGTGSLIQQVNNNGSKTFPVGNTTAYIPAVVNLSATSVTDNFSVRVKDDAYSDGESGNTVSLRAVKATWIISEAVAGGSDATITVQWPLTAELSGFDRSVCRLPHYHNNNWDYGNSDLAAAGTDPYTLTRSGITDFSPFAVSMFEALPLKWQYVKGFSSGGDNYIEWATLMEQSINYFSIEYSDDGFTFSEVGTVMAAGNSYTSNSYKFIHKTVTAPVSYYRIKQVDIDGKHSYSKIIKIYEATSPITQVLIVSNPVNTTLNLHIKSEKAASLILQVSDIHGRIIYSSYKNLLTGESTLSINLSGKTSGVYYLKLKDRQGFNQVIPFIKR